MVCDQGKFFQKLSMWAKQDPKNDISVLRAALTETALLSGTDNKDLVGFVVFFWFQKRGLLGQPFWIYDEVA